MWVYWIFCSNLISHLRCLILFIRKKYDCLHLADKRSDMLHHQKTCSQYKNPIFFFSKSTLKKNIQELSQSVKQLGFRSVPSYCACVRSYDLWDCINIQACRNLCWYIAYAISFNASPVAQSVVCPIATTGVISLIQARAPYFCGDWWSLDIFYSHFLHCQLQAKVCAQRTG